MKHIIITTIAAVLLVGCGGASGIQKAAISGNIEAVKQYLDDGADVNTKDEVGRTPLHVAARKGHKEIAKLLIAEGADVNTKDENSLTPLDLAIQNQGSVMYPGRQEESAALLAEQSIFAKRHIFERDIRGASAIIGCIAANHPRLPAHPSLSCEMCDSSFLTEIIYSRLEYTLRQIIPL